MNGPITPDTRQWSPVPVTILTGFLGSGKTSLLNHVLSSEHGLKIGVIVNEFGAISIDDKLITRQGEGIVELSNGCVCCSMSGDLIKALHRIREQESDIDYILIETSGLADPAPVAHHLRHENLSYWLRLDAIVTVVDAANFDANLDRAEAAFNQLVHGDIMLINKVDLVGPEIPVLIEQGIRKINAGARFLSASHAAIDPALILGVHPAPFDHTQARSSTDKPPEGTHHHHDLSDIGSLSLTRSLPLDLDAFRRFMESIPPSVFRAKGILHFAGLENRQIFHLVGERRTIHSGEPWQPGDTRTSELVLIGRDLDETGLTDGFDRCQIVEPQE